MADINLSDLAVGTAAEHLVCADLIMRGYRAFLADQNCPYDVAVDIGGRLLRVQVKATRTTRAIPQRRRSTTPAYLFHMNRCGKGGKLEYGAEVELFAFVALDRQLIGYLPAAHIKRTMMFRPKDSVGTYYGERNAERNKRILLMRDNAARNNSISSDLNVDKATVSRVCNSMEGVPKVGRYLEDFTLETALAGLG